MRPVQNGSPFPKPVAIDNSRGMAGIVVDVDVDVWSGKKFNPCRQPRMMPREKMYDEMIFPF